MTSSYSYTACKPVLELFATCNKRDREELLKHYKTLADNPFQKGDYLQRSSSGREFQVKRFGKWLITYWADHPVFEIRITDVKKLAP